MAGSVLRLESSPAAPKLPFSSRLRAVATLQDCQRVFRGNFCLCSAAHRRVALPRIGPQGDTLRIRSSARSEAARPVRGASMVPHCAKGMLPSQPTQAPDQPNSPGLGTRRNVTASAWLES